MLDLPSVGPGLSRRASPGKIVHGSSSTRHSPPGIMKGYPLRPEHEEALHVTEGIECLSLDHNHGFVIVLGSIQPECSHGFVNLLDNFSCRGGAASSNHFRKTIVSELLA